MHTFFSLHTESDEMRNERKSCDEESEKRGGGWRILALVKATWGHSFSKGQVACDSQFSHIISGMCEIDAVSSESGRRELLQYVQLDEM